MNSKPANRNQAYFETKHEGAQVASADLLPRIREAFERVRTTFPVQGHMERSPLVYESVATWVADVLPQDSSILDFGCGPADKTAVLSALGYRCVCVDDLNDPWHTESNVRSAILDFAKRWDIDYRVTGSDGTLDLNGETFDMVMLLDVLEHLHDSPRELMVSLVGLIKPGGYLFVGVPNAANIRKRLDLLRGRSNLPNFRYYYWMPGPWRGHVREYVRDDLIQLASYLGLHVIRLGTGNHMMERRLPRSARPLYVGLTTLFPGWRDTWLMVARRPAQWRPAKSPSLKDLYEMVGMPTRIGERDLLP